MRDQRIEGRAALGRVEPGDRPAIGRVGAKAVDGFGRKRDQSAGREHARGLGDGSRIGLQNARRQRGCHLSSSACLDSETAAACSPAGPTV